MLGFVSQPAEKFLTVSSKPLFSPLKQELLQLDIQSLDPIKVATFQKEMLNHAKKERNLFLAAHPFAVQLFSRISNFQSSLVAIMFFSLSCFLVFGIASLCGLLSPIFPAISIGIAFTSLLVAWSLDCIPSKLLTDAIRIKTYRWDQSNLSYYERAFSLPPQQHELLKKAEKVAPVTIEWLYLDPFAYVEHDGEKIYIAYWNAPGFEEFRI